jgi:uncharacterized membrane protein
MPTTARRTPTRPRRRSRPARTYPLLASDVVRGWIAVGVMFAMMTAVIVGVVRFDLLDELGGTTSELQGIGSLGVFAFLFSWTAFSVVSIVLAAVAFGRADGDTLARWMRDSPRPRSVWQHVWWGVNGQGAFWWAITGGGVSAIAMTNLVAGGSATPPIVLWSGIAVLAVSWALIAVSFAIHYARQHAVHGGYEFPTSADGAPRAPRFADFLYLALQVSTTFGPSDVTLLTSRARRATILHSVIAFLFNTIIVSCLVAVLLNLRGGS